MNVEGKVDSRLLLSGNDGRDGFLLTLRAFGVIFRVRHEYVLLRDDQRTQRATLPLEDVMVSNMWEIAEAFNLEYRVRRRASARVCWAQILRCCSG